MTWRNVLLGLLLGAVCGLPPASAQAPKRIGVLLVATACPTPPELVKSLAEMGWIEGRTVVFDCLSVLGKIDDLPARSAEIVAHKPDVIVSGYIPGIRALKAATSTIPIVALNMADPVGQGLIDSLSRPGGNVTGLVSVMFELESKRIELLQQALPKMTRLAVVYRKGGDERYRQSTEQALAQASKARRFSHKWFYPEKPEELPAMFNVIAAEKFDAVYLVPNPTVEGNAVLIGQEVTRHRLPAVGQNSTIGLNSNITDAGVLLAYGPSTEHIAQRAAAFIDKILKGARPATLPAEQPTKFELIVNLKTARALGIAIPQSILLRADRIIE